MDLFKIFLFGGLLISYFLNKTTLKFYRSLYKRKRVAFIFMLMFMVIACGSIEYNNILGNISNNSILKSVNGYIMGFSLHQLALLLSPKKASY